MTQKIAQAPRQLVDKLPEDAVEIPQVKGAWITPSGDIFSNACGKLLKLRFRLNSSGYWQVGLIDELGRRRSFLVHRILALLFVAGDTSLTVDHRDGNRQNNRLDNLRWITRRENSRLGLERHPEKMKLARSAHAKKVRGTSIRTGEVVEFSSVVLASVAVRGRRVNYQYKSPPCGSNISRAIQNGKPAYGYRWEYL